MFLKKHATYRRIINLPKMGNLKLKKDEWKNPAQKGRTR
jgi:hypothetical protein